MSLPFPASPNPSRKSSVKKWLACLVLVGVALYIAHHENIHFVLPPLGFPSAPPADPNAHWLGCWFKRSDLGDAYELPLVEFRTATRGMTGRIIYPGDAKSDRDVVVDLTEMLLQGETLTFVASGTPRTRYRMIDRAGDSAELYAVGDHGHLIDKYLGGSRNGPGAFAASQREEMLNAISNPQPPLLIARLTRIHAATPGLPVPRAAAPAAPARGLTGKTTR